MRHRREHFGIPFAFLWFVLTGGLALSADSLPRGDWVAHGFPAKRREELRRFLQESVERGDIPGGALLLIHKGEVIFEEGFGYADIKKKRPFLPTDPCGIASLSKPIVATLLVKLAEDGMVDLDAPIDMYLPLFKDVKLRTGEAASRPPTARECLKHIGGFTPDEAPGGRPWLRLTRKGLSLVEVVEEEAKQGLYCDPGKKFAYSGIGYDVVGRIAEVVAGKNLNSLLQEKLCAPLGMKHTTYYPDAAMRAEQPKFYWQWRSDGSLHAKLSGSVIREGEYHAVGGGIASTLQDMATFLLLHRDGGVHEARQIVGRESLREMYKRCSPGSYYGLGFCLGPSTKDGLGAWLFHSGSSGTMCWLDFERDMIGVLFTQCSRSEGRNMPESEKKIPKDQPSWLKPARSKISSILDGTLSGDKRREETDTEMDRLFPE